MSAIGTKRTSSSALHMSAFGGKADIAPASRAAVPLTRRRLRIWFPLSCEFLRLGDLVRCHLVGGIS